MEDSTPLLGDRTRLAERFDADGYLLFRSLLDPATVAAATDVVTDRLAAAGWFGADGAGSALVPTRPDAGRDLYRDRRLFEAIFSDERLHCVGHDPALVDVVASLLGTATIFVHPNPAIRVVFPDVGGGEVTPAHQDASGMQGSTGAVTAWIPLSPCPVVAGPIAVASGSHRGGIRPVAVVPGARVLPCDDEGLEESWVTTDLAPGDVVIFAAIAVHRTPANSSDAVRLSIDFRYQRRDEPVSDATVRPPAGMSWAAIRERWSDTRLISSYDEDGLTVVPFDISLVRTRNER